MNIFEIIDHKKNAPAYLNIGHLDYSSQDFMKEFPDAMEVYAFLDDKLIIKPWYDVNTDQEIMHDNVWDQDSSAYGRVDHMEEQISLVVPHISNWDPDVVLQERKIKHWAERIKKKYPDYALFVYDGRDSYLYEADRYDPSQQKGYMDIGHQTWPMHNMDLFIIMNGKLHIKEPKISTHSDVWKKEWNSEEIQARGRIDHKEKAISLLDHTNNPRSLTLWANAMKKKYPDYDLYISDTTKKWGPLTLFDSLHEAKNENILQDKALLCLTIATLPSRSHDRHRRWGMACRQYNEEEILQQMQELLQHGYIEIKGNARLRTATITDKGRKVLTQHMNSLGAW